MILQVGVPTTFQPRGGGRTGRPWSHRGGAGGAVEKPTFQSDRLVKVSPGNIPPRPWKTICLS